jgi:opacity protein-like surface antigen
MKIVQLIVIAGTISVAATSMAAAADLRGTIDYEPLPVYEEVMGGGWYLRGDIGITNQSTKRLTNAYYDTPGAWPVEFLHKGFASSPFIGVGVGYAFNNWLRVDVTGEYRSKASFSALDRYGPDLAVFSPLNGTNYYTAKKHEWVGLVNAYLDLGTWHGITPFVGAGIGVAKVTIADFTDTNTVQGAVWSAPSASRTNLAWALYAGAAVDVTDRLKFELAYRYLRIGDARAGSPNIDLTNFYAPVTEPWVFKRVDSHDVKVGMRWMLAPPARLAHHWPEEPIVRKH